MLIYRPGLRLRMRFHRRQHQYRSNTPCGIGEVLDFFGFEGTVEDVAFAVGEPFFEDLVATEFVGPDGGGDVAPEGAVVQVHVEGGFAERGMLSPIAAFSSGV